MSAMLSLLPVQVAAHVASRSKRRRFLAALLHKWPCSYYRVTCRNCNISVFEITVKLLSIIHSIQNSNMKFLPNLYLLFNGYHERRSTSEWVVRSSSTDLFRSKDKYF